PSTTRPSPQIATQAEGLPRQLNPGSTVQVGEQPSPAVVLPSSHCSGPVTRSSPQIGAHIDGAPVPNQPRSDVQGAEQPSPPVVWPSSHPSPASGAPLPQAMPTVELCAVAMVSAASGGRMKPAARRLFVAVVNAET